MKQIIWQNLKTKKQNQVLCQIYLFYKSSKIGPLTGKHPSDTQLLANYPLIGCAMHNMHCAAEVVIMTYVASFSSRKMEAGFRAALVFTFAIGVTLATKQNVFARLIDDLFDDAGYAKDAIPMKKPADKSSNINSINVAVGVSVISMDLEPRGVLSASTWLRTSWEDYRLQLDPHQ